MKFSWFHYIGITNRQSLSSSDHSYTFLPLSHSPFFIFFSLSQIIPSLSRLLFLLPSLSFSTSSSLWLFLITTERIPGRLLIDWLIDWFINYMFYSFLFFSFFESWVLFLVSIHTWDFSYGGWFSEGLIDSVFLFLLNLWCFGIWVLFFDLSFWSYDTIPLSGSSDMNLILCFRNIYWVSSSPLLEYWEFGLVVIQLFLDPLVQENSIGC